MLDGKADSPVGTGSFQEAVQAESAEEEGVLVEWTEPREIAGEVRWGTHTGLYPA